MTDKTIKLTNVYATHQQKLLKIRVELVPEAVSSNGLNGLDELVVGVGGDGGAVVV